VIGRNPVTTDKPMVKTAANPEGLPRSAFDDLQAQLAANRSKFYRDVPEGLSMVITAGGEVLGGGDCELVAAVDDGRGQGAL
jgi:hypothetical protein